MNIEYFREYCLNKQGVTEGFPFDSQTLVFKVLNRMFALTDVDMFQSINLKCDPQKALQLREEYRAVSPGYHMNKRHWNTVIVNSDVSDKVLLEMVDTSYNLVIASLPKKEREKFG